jgi:two-component system sensor histidine kinase UhpB
MSPRTSAPYAHTNDRNAAPLDDASPSGVADAVLRRHQHDELRILAARVRVGLLISLAVIVALAVAVDPLVHAQGLTLLYAIKVVALAAGAVVWRLSRSATRPSLIRASALIVVLYAAAISVSSIVVGEDWSAAVLCLLIATVAAGLFPWGVRTQIVVAPLLLFFGVLPVVVVGDGTKIFFVCLISALFAVGSVLIAREQESFGRSTWQSLLFFRENMERLRQIAEHIDGVLWLGEHGARGDAYLYVSPRYDDLWGVDRAHLQERPDAWLDAVHPDDRARVAERFRDGTASGEYGCEYRLQRPDGTQRWIRDYAFPIRDVERRTHRLARLSQDVTAEREAASAHQMREIARSIQGAQEQERRRIARELHDELGQVLTAIKLRLGSVRITAGDAVPQATSEMDACASAVDDAMRSVHGMIHRLRPPILDDLGLIAALRTQVEAFTHRTGIACDVELPESEPELSDEELTAVFRVAQESLTNVARHAEARRVQLRLLIESSGLRLLVADDGRGLGTAKHGFGMRGMGERAALLNGSLRVDPGPERGTLVRLELPRSTPGDIHDPAHPARR